MFSLPHHSPRDLPFGRRQTAILFVDMQRAWVEPGRDPHVDPQAAGYFYERVQNQVIPNQQRLLRAMRAVDENVLHTVIESLTADGRDRSLDHKLSEMHLPKGSPDARVIDALEPTANEIVLPKTSSGVFNSTAIDYVLRNLGHPPPDRLRGGYRPVRGHGRARCRRPRLPGHPGRGCLRHPYPGTPPGLPGSDQGLLLDQRHRDRPATHRRPRPEQPVNRLQPVRLVSFVTTDLAGITRGRSLPLATLEEQLASGCGWVPANSSLTPQDLIDESSPWGSHGDLRLLPDPNSRVRVEQGPDAAAPALDYLHGNLVETDGTPWPACPRSLLRAEVERYRDSGLQVIAAFEHEFSLLGLPGERPAAAFSLQAQRAAGQFPGWLVSALAQAGTEPEMFLPEYGQRQYEVTCRPAQGVAAADRAVNVREVTREVARQMGLRTCFAPLPAPGAVTNGVHLHLSLQHADGSPLLYEPGRPNDLSELGEHWAAGVLAHLPALCALTAPTAASYLRLKPHHWSAAYACLGLRNREAALRICPVVSVGGKPLGKQYNLEFRPMDATACPHLAMAAVLIAGRLGIERRLPLRALADIDPHGLSDEERQARGIQALPATLGDALDCLQRDEALCAELPKPLLDTYLAMKRHELALTAGLSDDDLCRHYAELY